MKSIIGEGSSVEEAVDQALKRLGVRIDQVNVRVLEEQRGRLFGLLGGRKFRVEVTPRGETAERLEEIVGGTMRHLGIPSQVEVVSDNGDYTVQIGTVDSDGLLIGKHGETLYALEHLLNRIVHKDRNEQGRVRVDVGGYRERRDDQLREKALGMARRVKETGREVSTDPLFSPDRRIIHLALSNDTSVRTYTVGDGLYKSVVVAPSDRGSGRSTGRPSGRPGGRSRSRSRPGQRRSRSRS